MLEILYEDNHLIAINKKSGDIVQADKTSDLPISDYVKSYIPEEFKLNVADYSKKTSLKSEIERLHTKKTKTGVESTINVLKGHPIGASVRASSALPRT